MHFPCFLFLSVLLSQVAQESNVTTRTYGLSGLVEWGHWEPTFDLCPRRGSPAENKGADLDEPDEPDGIFYGDISEVLPEILGRKGLKDGLVKVELMGARLVATASDDVHAEIARLVDLIDSACLGEERLQIRVITSEQSLDAPLILDPAEAERRVSEITSSGKGAVGRAGSTSLVDSFVRHIDASDTEAYSKDWGVEIAHGAVVYDPVWDSRKMGLTASVRAARAKGATYVDIAIRHADTMGPMREEVLEPRIWMASPGPLEAEHGGLAHGPGGPRKVGVSERVPILVELPLDRFTSYAGSFLLPDGKVLWIPFRVVTHAGIVAGALEIRVLGPCRPFFQLLGGKDDKNDARCYLLHLGSFLSGGFECPPLSRMAFVALPYLSEWPSRIQFLHNEAQEVLAVVKDALPEMETDESIGASLLSEGHLLLEAPGSMRERVTERLSTFFKPGRPFEIEGKVKSGEERLAEFRIPALTGKLSTIWSGLQGSYLADWDVDVANEAAVANPEIDSFLDGFALRFLVRTLSNGRIQVTVNGKLSFLEGPPALTDLKNPYTPSVDKIKARTLFLDESRYLQDQKDIPVLRFGDERLALEISLVSLGEG